MDDSCFRDHLGNHAGFAIVKRADDDFVPVVVQHCEQPCSAQLAELKALTFKCLSVSDAEKLVHAFMSSRLDYCNALLVGCPASSINKLQIVQNAAARVLTRSRKYDHITPILQSLHWLPIKFRISYKILLLAYKALNDLAPAYLTNLLSRYNPTHSLRSQNSGL